MDEKRRKNERKASFCKEIITIDAQKWIEDLDDKLIQDAYDIDRGDDIYADYYDTFKADYVYKLDLSEDMGMNPYVRDIHSVQENALFYQMDSLLNTKKTNERSLIHSLLYLDFGKIFNDIDKTEIVKQENSVSRNTPEENNYFDKLVNAAKINSQLTEDLWLTPEDFADSYEIVLRERLKSIINKGIDISFTIGGRKESKHFVAFDKSSSMGRRSTISYIDESLLEPLNKRLLLDMDLTEVDLNLAKFYAYKGLYFTSSRRINTPDIILNEETVVVLPDYAYNPQKEKENLTVDTITAIPPEEGKEASNQIYTICNKFIPLSEILKNLFDGEGLICPTYSSAINKELELCEKAASYQIRMPFVKGVLHTVDFESFIKEYGTSPNDEYWVKDAFKKDRDITKAKIILTESMFKCSEWVKAYADKEGLKDPMQHYFETFQKHRYNHALYVANTDKSYRERNLVQLNYQFLNTLCFTKDEFDALLETHKSTITNPVSYLLNHAVIKEDDDNVNENQINEDQFSSGSENWLDLLEDYKNNPDVLNKLCREPFISQQLTNTAKSIRNKLADGKYLISGEIRFLSRDLLYLLYNLLNEEDQRTLGVGITKEFLAEDEFDMPGNCCNLIDKYHYTIFRSPHLSRNEQCALKFRKTSAKSVRRKYLNDLKGVIMISHKSVDPQTLGGADFDGDLVKIFNNDIIRDCVLRNRYDMKGAYKPGHNYLRSMALPIIYISQYKIELNDTYKARIDFDIIANTFSNNIGHLSNLSALFGKYIYSKDARDFISKSSNDCCKENASDKKKNQTEQNNFTNALENLANSMHESLMNLNLSDENQKNISFGSKHYKYDELMQMSEAEYRKTLEEICLENLCASLTIYTGMDIDAPKNNIRPNISKLFNDIKPMERTYNYVGDFLNKKEKMMGNLIYQSKFSFEIGEDENKEKYYQLGGDSYHIQYPCTPDNKMFSIDLIPYFFFRECVSKTGKEKGLTLKRGNNSSLSLIAANAKKVKPDDHEYTSMANAMKAYKDISTLCQKKAAFYAYHAKGKRLENAELICQRQYPETDKYKDLSILYNLFLKLNINFESLCRLHKELAFSDWAFSAKNERKEFLNEILSDCQKDICANDMDNFINSDSASLLFNFSHKGYFLLYLLIGKAIDDIIINNPTIMFDATYNQKMEETDVEMSDDDFSNEEMSDAFEEETVSDEDMQKEYEKYYSKLHKSIVSKVQSIGYKKNMSSYFTSSLESFLIASWHDLIESEELDTDLIRVIAISKEYKASTPMSRIFWNTFSEDEIKNLIEEEIGETADKKKKAKESNKRGNK